MRIDIRSQIIVLSEDNLREKIKPLVFDPAIRAYFGIGKYLGTAFSAGKKQKA